jgi:hypothetical protein
MIDGTHINAGLIERVNATEWRPCRSRHGARGADLSHTHIFGCYYCSQSLNAPAVWWEFKPNAAGVDSYTPVKRSQNKHKNWERAEARELLHDDVLRLSHAKAVNGNPPRVPKLADSGLSREERQARAAAGKRTDPLARIVIVQPVSDIRRGCAHAPSGPRRLKTHRWGSWGRDYDKSKGKSTGKGKGKNKNRRESSFAF